MKAKTVIGCREWFRMPDLGIPGIIAKIDTGAESSALHAFRIKEIVRDGVTYVHFFVHPVQRRRHPEIECVAPLVDNRSVRSSNGKEEIRPVISTRVVIGPHAFETELTLTNRDKMGYRMLLGRKSMKPRFLIDPGGFYAYGDHQESEFYDLLSVKNKKKAKPS